MCNFPEELNPDVFRNKSVKQLFPLQDSLLPWEIVQPGCCAFSRQPLDYDYMHNTGATKRWLCEHEYQGIIGQRTEYCRLCGKRLENGKSEMQGYQQREIANYFCSECMIYLCLCSMKIVGKDMSFLLEEQGYNPSVAHLQAQVLERKRKYDREFTRDTFKPFEEVH